jgi:hypothetical protein
MYQDLSLVAVTPAVLAVSGNGAFIRGPTNDFTGAATAFTPSSQSHTCIGYAPNVFHLKNGHFDSVFAV